MPDRRYGVPRIVYSIPPRRMDTGNGQSESAAVQAEFVPRLHDREAVARDVRSLRFRMTRRPSSVPRPLPTSSGSSPMPTSRSRGSDSRPGTRAAESTQQKACSTSFESTIAGRRELVMGQRSTVWQALRHQISSERARISTCKEGLGQDLDTPRSVEPSVAQQGHPSMRVESSCRSTRRRRRVQPRAPRSVRPTTGPVA